MPFDPPKSGSSHPQWRGDTAPSSAGGGPSARQSSKGKKLVGLVTFLLALASAVVGLVFYLQNFSPPAFFSLAIREYKSPLFPVNAWAVQDGALLTAHFPGNDERTSYLLQDWEGFRRALKDVRQVGDRPVVLYVNALTRADGDDVYVLPADAEPLARDLWIPLTDVLQSLRASPSSAKLLILDCMKPLADARLGILADNVAEKVQNQLAKEKDLPFWVLCACSAHQASLTSEELGQSVFAYYLDDGLRGAADGVGANGKKDHRIDVKELADFVKQRVERWAWTNRGVHQTPVLLGQSQDFPLILFDEYIPRETPTVETPPQSDKAPPESGYPKWLREGWQKRDQWKEDLARFGPVVLRQADALLLRAEQRWRGGLEEKRLKPELDLDLKRLDDQVKRIASRPRVPISSLTHKLANGKMLAPALLDSLQQFVRTAPLEAKSEAKPSEEDKKRQAEQEKEIKKLAEALKAQSEEAALAIFNLAESSTNIQPAHILLLQKLLGELDLKKRYDETVYLDCLRTFIDDVRGNNLDWPAADVHAALAALRAAEEVVADLAEEPAALAWIRDLLQEAQEKRRSGEKKLFIDYTVTQASAGEDLGQALQLYRIIRNRIGEFAHAQHELDRALAELPMLGSYLIAKGTFGPRDKRAWDDIIESASKLSEALARPDPGFFTTGRLDVADTLKQQRQSLEAIFRSDVQHAVAVTDDTLAEDYGDLQAVLSITFFDAAGRENAWKASRKLALRFLQATQALDEGDRLGKTTGESKNVSSRVETGLDSVEAARREGRARQALDLARLTGVPSLEPGLRVIEDDLKKADESAWKDAGQRLADLWGKQLLQQYLVNVAASANASATSPKAGAATTGAGSPTLPAGLPQADRLSRLLYPFDLERIVSTDSADRSRNPTLVRHLQAQTSLNRWLADHYQAESSLFQDRVPSAVLYFSDRSEDFARAAALGR